MTFGRLFSVYEHSLLCYFADIQSLFQEIRINCFVLEWRLCTDSLKQRLQAVLLLNKNTYPSIPGAHSSHVKENYESVTILLELIKSKDHDWNISGDFKMIAFFSV